MIDISLLLETSLIAIAFTVVAILFERFLIIKGLVKGRTIALAVGTFISTFLLQYVDQTSWRYIFGFLLAIGGPIGINRDYLAMSYKKGKWWWKSK